MGADIQANKIIVTLAAEGINKTPLINMKSVIAHKATILRIAAGPVFFGLSILMGISKLLLYCRIFCKNLLQFINCQITRTLVLFEWVDTFV